MFAQHHCGYKFVVLQFYRDVIVVSLNGSLNSHKNVILDFIMPLAALLLLITLLFASQRCLSHGAAL